MTSEAFVLNLLDDLDAKVNYLNRLADQTKEPGYQWSEFQRTMERFLFVRGRMAEENSEEQPVEEPSDSAANRQQTSLW
jgi:3'-5' exoribonuclease